ncbi:uncharacterized protein [Nicotiana sylvestris]|uniref:uncharacterized protein n=1 Tax=Nicotiana sylvestris TaxID=4096 RepID=UPI00388C6929
MDSMTQAGLFPADPATSHAGGGAQTPTTPAPGHAAAVYQTPDALPANGDPPVAAVAPQPKPAVDGDSHKLLDRWTRLYPPVFEGERHEDTQDFIDRCRDRLHYMRILESHGVDFTTFQLEGRARRWWQSYVLGKPAGSPPITWGQFAQLFLDRYRESSEICCRVTPQYSGMAREVEIGTEYQLVEEIARRIEGYHQRGREQMQHDKRARFFGEFRGTPARGRGQLGRDHPSRPPYSAPPSARGAPARPYFSAMPKSLYHPPAIQGSSGGYSGPQGSSDSYFSAMPESSYRLFRLLPMGLQAIRPAGASARFYALPARPDAVASDAVITSIISVGGRDTSILFDPGSTYSYVSSLFAHFLVISLEPLGIPVHVSTLVGDSMVVDRIYRSCMVTFYGFKTSVDLLLLDMIDFEIILGMDWLSTYHSVIDCHAKTITLAMPGLSRLEWKGSTVDTSSWVISILKARKMVEKWCLAYLAYVRDTTAESPTIDSVPVVREFADVFPSDLPSMPPDRDIDFYIDLSPGTQPASVPPYRMASKELKELKEQLGELLAKGFVRPSVSSWGAPMLFVKKKDGTMRMVLGCSPRLN